MRADRLLSILLMLQVHRRLTARELAKRLEVSERTIHRDMEALGAAGVPVVAERGAGGGWRLLEPYQTNLTGLSKPEVRSLFLGNPSGLLADLGLREASATALIKLLAALPSVFRRDAEYVRQRIHVDGAAWHPSNESVSFLPLIHDAIWQERKISVTYERSDGTAVERVTDPLGLVAKGSAWYLVAAVEGEIRAYRVSRIRRAHVTDEPCVRPEGFDLAAFWERSSAEFISSLPRYAVTVRAAPDVVPRMRYGGRFARIETIEPPEADGWRKVRIRFDTEQEAAEYVLSFGPRIEVFEPDELRGRVLGLAESVVALYRRAGRGRSARIAKGS